MRIDGKAIAEKILNDLTPEVATLKLRRVIPILAVIQVGNDPASTVYIRQKRKAAEMIGAKVVLYQVSSIKHQGELQNIIQKFNDDSSIHGIIVQRPLPSESKVNPSELLTILPAKDIDGFLPNSPYPVPVASAVVKILHFAFSQFVQLDKLVQFDQWIKKQQIVLIGRGETAGKPIADLLIKLGANITVVHSQTPNPDAITRTADIIVSCVGKQNVVRRDNIKAGALLISVGITRGTDDKLHGDYEEDQIMELASFYTPTPGGVGPVNVAALMANLIQAASNAL